MEILILIFLGILCIMSNVALILLIQCLYELVYAYYFYNFLKICKVHISVMNNKKNIVMEIVLLIFIGALCILSNVT